MALDNERLKNSIKAALLDEQTEEEDASASLERISGKIANAVILEIKSMGILYTDGLLAPNGAVTGTLNVTIE